MRSELSLVTAPAYEPISLSSVKLWLRVDQTTEDALIGSLIVAARSWIEQVTRRALITQTWDWRLSAFPSDESELRVPKAPLQSVTSITYLDSAGTSQTWSTSDYDVSTPAGPEAQMGRIQLAYTEDWPSTYDEINAVTVRFVAGYAPETSKVVSGITQASGTATATTSTAHGYITGDLVYVSGAGQADYNGVHEVTVTTTTAFTFPVPSGTTTPATGTMAAGRLPLPRPVVAALRMLIAYWFERRGDETQPVTMPPAIEALLWPYRVLGWD
jgi:uncharacterized phiE125 gp8 family phage protein